MKSCCRCKQELELDCFGTDRRAPDGKNYKCMACVRAVNSPEYRQRARLKTASAQKKYRTKNAVEVKAASRRYYVRTRDQKLVYSRAVYQEKKAYYNERNAANWWAKRAQYMVAVRRWAASAHGKAVVHLKNARRRAFILEVVSPADIERIVNAFDGQCAWCCRARGATIDHVMPLARGGAHARTNLVPACKSCNSRKRDMLPEVWAAKIGADLSAVMQRAAGEA